MNILLVGSAAREHAIARAIKRSPQPTRLFCFGSSNNPGIRELCDGYTTGKVTDVNEIVTFAKKENITWAIIGPEAPLEAGVADALWKINIPCVGPKKKLAQLETSKSFTRNLFAKYQIPGLVKYKIFQSMAGVREFIVELNGNYVVKADGLMGGKGVKVAGDHLAVIEDGLRYCEELIATGSKFLIEEKLTGQEFSLMSFCDGKHLAHMPLVQDHKRAFVGDTGPNTGGMGSYSDANHLLPFLTVLNMEQAQAINQATAQALYQEFNEGYKGILYGGFMVTRDGVKVIEYNARFGDPEAMNVLAILESDFVAICETIINGTLTPPHAQFAHQATVCKYAVPEGYPDNPVKNQLIDISDVQNKNQLYFAAVNQRDDGLYETGSRTIAIVGIAYTIVEAEMMAEAEIRKVKGPLFHREDIGTNALIQKRIEAMREPLKLAILGSTKGTDMQAIINAIKQGELDASLEIVISNKSDAYILERARNHGIEAIFIDPKGKTKEAFDETVSKILQSKKVDLIILIGYMRILSAPFVRQWPNKIINVHPSLLPDFAGGMDADVHAAVLKSGMKETGCTVHIVDEGVDTGPILVQKRCPVEPDETAESLKAKVQKLEGEALIEAIKKL